MVCAPKITIEKIGKTNLRSTKMEDKRFAHIESDPKYRRIPKGARKVKIDKRFESMFKDEKFKAKYTVDKRGRPVNRTSTEDLKRYYQLSSDESSSDEESNEPGRFVKTLHKHDLDVKEESDKRIPDEIKKKLRNLSVDYARGESALFSESSSDNEECEELLSEGETIEHNWGELDNDADPTNEATYRLAACNMDWDRIRAVDLMVMFNSFLPAGGTVESVIIYPSNFGKERMEEEEIKGPIELVENKEAEDNEEGSKYHMEKLRQYQLNRLKYYYAVITCDSANTANKIYAECDGMEYESSATKVDLRFIPDDMTFDDEAKEICDKLPELDKYQPRFFTTTALQQAKVDLTWDETDPDRIELTQKLNSGKIEGIQENHLQNYLVVSGDEESENSDKNDSSEDEQKKDPIDKYKQLLQEIKDKEQEKKNRDIEMEISWGIDLKDKTEKLLKQKIEDELKTPFQKYLDKRKEKRKEKKKQKKPNDDVNSDDMPSDIDMNDPYFKEEFDNPEFKRKKTKKQKEKHLEDVDPQLELLLINENDNKSHFNLTKIRKEEEASKKKRKHKNLEDQKVDDFEVNVNDDRFSAVFTSHLYNIDPTDPHYKKTKGMETLINEKIKRRKSDVELDVKKSEKSNIKHAELSVLVKSVKRKAALLNKIKK